jgi:hypothetical protein
MSDPTRARAAAGVAAAGLLVALLPVALAPSASAAPAPPPSVTVTDPQVGGGKVRVRWAPAASARAYVVTVNGTQVARLPRTARTTTVQLLPGRNRVGVAARDREGLSARRAVTVAVKHAPPSAPTDVHVVQTGAGTGYLVWQPPVLRPGQRVSTYRVAVPGRTIVFSASARRSFLSWSPTAASVSASVRAVSGAGLVGPSASATLRPGGGGYAPAVAPAFATGESGSAAPGPEVPAAATLGVTPTWTLSHPRGIAGVYLDGRLVVAPRCATTFQAVGTSRRAVALQLAFSAVVTGCDGRSATYTRRFVTADGTDAWLGGSATWSRVASSSAYGSDAITGEDGDYVGWGFGPFSALAVTGVRQPGGGTLRISTGGRTVVKVPTTSTVRQVRTVLWQTSWSTPVTQSYYAGVASGSVELDSFALIRPVPDGTPVVDLGSPTQISSGGHAAFPGATRLPDGRIVAVWRQSSGHNALDGRVHAAWSDDDGATWTADREVLRIEGSDVRDPALWVADDGSLMMAVYYKNSTTGGIRGVRLHRSTDDGDTWGDGEQLSTGYSGGSSGNPPVEVDGRWILPLHAFSSSRSTRFSAYVASSDDGVTFSTPQLVLDGDAEGVAAAEPGVHVLPDGTVLMTLRSTSRWGSSDDGGRTWQLRASPLDSASRLASYVDSRGRVVSIYRSWAGYGAELRVSGDGGRTYGSPRVIATGPSRMDYAALVPLGGDRVLLVLAMEFGNGDLSDVTARVIEVR